MDRLILGFSTTGVAGLDLTVAAAFALAKEDARVRQGGTTRYRAVWLGKHGKRRRDDLCDVVSFCLVDRGRRSGGSTLMGNPAGSFPLTMPVFFIVLGAFSYGVLQRSWGSVWHRQVLPCIYLFVVWPVIGALYRASGLEVSGTGALMLAGLSSLTAIVASLLIQHAANHGRTLASDTTSGAASS
jgi:hypothetical protein